jgi:hypothetical protein
MGRQIRKFAYLILLVRLLGFSTGHERAVICQSPGAGKDPPGCAGTGWASTGRAGTGWAGTGYAGRNFAGKVRAGSCPAGKDRGG